MDVDPVSDVSVSVDDIDTNRSELGSCKVESVAGTSISGEINGELGRAGGVLTGIDHDLACTFEKFYNLNILMMHVATEESEFEVLDSERGQKMASSLEKGLKCDILSGFLDSEVKELDDFITTLQKEIEESRKWIYSSQNLGTSSLEWEEKLSDSEKTLEQLREQVFELQAQSSMFQKTLSCFIGEERRERETGAGFLANGGSLNVETKTKIQTATQHKHFLRMLEKSLARELDLEKKLSETKQSDEDMKLRLQSAEQEVFCLEEVFDAWERLFEADNSAEVLLGISRDLLGRLQVTQFNTNDLIQREAELRSKLDNTTEQLKVKESALLQLKVSRKELSDSLSAQVDGLRACLEEVQDKLNIAKSENSILQDKVTSLERQVKEFETAKGSEDGSQEETNVAVHRMSEMESLIEDLKKKLSEAESTVENAETNYKSLEVTNKKLNEELVFLKSSCLTVEKGEALERQLKESDILLQCAVASADASEEKQAMLYSAIKDMENIIEDLKLKVAKAESRADSAEEKCVILSESNAELTDELIFLRGRMQGLEGALHHAEESKLAAAKNIGIQAKVIANLVMQLAIERERLHKQLTSLAIENKILVVKLQQTSKGSTVPRNHDGGQEDPAFEFPVAASARECKEIENESLPTSTLVVYCPFTCININLRYLNGKTHIFCSSFFFSTIIMCCLFSNFIHSTGLFALHGIICLKRS
ncbi:hypothetical protein BT93_L1958 [Corymbia citriodora subsp. variegata]|uniref:WIT1/2 N-terminal helical bundle domain-containing protein n=1 Tax=Corymbia citriodora subsp. variegata TaxID=360336 RepID=A0A8T0CQD9_CORYI|nr:hypothetical protein BT93_L1958 [Corymbia citriodora subsp. variegata]